MRIGSTSCSPAPLVLLCYSPSATMDDMLPPTPLYLPYSLPFPITLQRLTAPTSSNILKSAPLFTYSYHATLDGIRERQVSSWHSPVQGQIVNWAVKEGQLISDAR